MSTPRSRETCDVGGEGLPTCATGPLGRLGWTLRELADLLGLRRRDHRAR